MKIIVFTAIESWNIGGPATHIEGITEWLSKMGHEIRIINLRHPGHYVRDFHELGIYSIYYFCNVIVKLIYLNFYLFFKLFKLASDCDLIYINHPSLYSLVVLMFAKLRRKALISRFVGDVAWEFAINQRQTTKELEDFLASPEGDLRVKILHNFERRVLTNVNKIIVPAKWLADLLVNYYDVKAEKIRIINNSIDFRYCTSLPKRRRFNITRALRIITISRLVQTKRVDLILKAFKKISLLYPKAELWIVGDGQEKADLERLTRELDIISKVNWFGVISHEQVLKLLRNADIMLLNSIYEGLPHTVIEAMACMTTVIATSTKGTREIITNGLNGILIPINDVNALVEKVLVLIENKEFRERLTDNGFKLVQEVFTWEKNILSLERELKDEVLRDKRRSS